MWEPGTRSLRSLVEDAFASACHEDGANGDAETRAAETVRAFTDVGTSSGLPETDGLEAGWEPAVSAEAELLDRAMRNYLAARVFGNWIAYQGRGLRTIVEWLRTCAAAVRHHARQRMVESQRTGTARDLLESIRAADLLLLHTIDTQAFARQASALEGGDRR
jgi:hypothetical protein